MDEKFEMNIDYICNPDVVLREEDEYGGLLFNPDTNQIKVINTTGLFIWKQFGSKNKPINVATALLDAFDGASDEEITQDLGEFLEGMLMAGFIGEILE